MTSLATTRLLVDASAGPAPDGLTDALRRLIRAVGQAGGMRRSRRRLASLDDHLLRDVGLSRWDAAAEATRPCWDAGPAVAPRAR